MPVDCDLRAGRDAAAAQRSGADLCALEPDRGGGSSHRDRLGR